MTSRSGRQSGSFNSLVRSPCPSRFILCHERPSSILSRLCIKVACTMPCSCSNGNPIPAVLGKLKILFPVSLSFSNPTHASLIVKCSHILRTNYPIPNAHNFPRTSARSCPSTSSHHNKACTTDYLRCSSCSDHHNRKLEELETFFVTFFHMHSNTTTYYRPNSGTLTTP